MAQYDLVLTQNVAAAGTEYTERFVTMAKGNLISANSSSVPTILVGGTNGYYLQRDDLEVTGLKWVSISPGVTPVDSPLFDWITASLYYDAYASADKGNGRFYYGVTDPTYTTRLNYDGYIYATKLYSGGTEVSVAGHTHSYVAASGTPADNQVAVWLTASSIEGSSGLTFDGSTLYASTILVPITTGFIKFGDADSYFFESTDDQIMVALASTNRWRFTSTAFRMDSNGGPALAQTNSSATVPVFNPINSDTATGVGGAASTVSLIVASTTILTASASAVTSAVYISQTAIDIRTSTSKAIYYDTTSNNVRIGGSAGNDSMTQSIAHVLIGYQTGTNLTTNNGCVFIGSNAGTGCTSGTYNTGIGGRTLQYVDTGQQNMALGFAAMRYSTGSYNAVVGYSSFMGASGLTTGSYNSALGNLAGGSARTAHSNVVIGYQSMYEGQDNVQNIYIGAYAGYYNWGSYNVAIGYNALRGVTGGGSTGGYNTVIGFQAGDSITSGTHNLLLGYNVDVASATTTYQFRLGDTTTYLLEGNMTSTIWVGTDYEFRTDTIAEFTAAAGVTIDGVVVKDYGVTVPVTTGKFIFGDGDSYFIESSDDLIELFTGGTKRYAFLGGTSAVYMKMYMDVANDRYGYIHYTNSGTDFTITASSSSVSGGTHINIMGGSSSYSGGAGGNVIITAGSPGAGGTAGQITMASKTVFNSTVYINSLASATTSYVLYYDFSTGQVTYGSAPGGGVTPVDSTLLDWSTDRYLAYSSKQSGGELYTGTTAATASTRLNYNGYLYATMFYVTDASSNTSYLSSLQFSISPSAVQRTSFNPATDDTGSNIAYLFDTVTSLTTGRKLVSVKNSGTERFYIDPTGNTWAVKVTIQSSEPTLSFTDGTYTGSLYIDDPSHVFHLAAGTGSQLWFSTPSSMYAQTSSAGFDINNVNVTYSSADEGIVQGDPRYETTSVGLTVKGGSVTAATGNWNGGHLYLYGGAGWGSGTRGNIYFGSGAAGYLPAKGSETNVVYYDTATGKLSYGAPGGGVTLTGSTDNTICTVTGANAIQGEANLTYDGTTLTIANTNAKLKTDHIGENTTSHSIVMDNGVDFVGSMTYGGGACAAKFQGDMWFLDGYWMTFGTDVDSYAFWSHSGDSKYCFHIDYYGAATRFLFRGKDAGGVTREMLSIYPRAGVEMAYNGTKKFETTSAGVSVSGTLLMTSNFGISFEKDNHHSIEMAAQDGTSNGYNLTIAGAYGPANYDGGKVYVQGGATTGTGDGGAVHIKGGNGGASSGGVSGNVHIYPGTTGYALGNVTLAYDGSSAYGYVGIRGGANSSYALYVTGAIYATGDITGNSDIREKVVFGSLDRGLENLMKVKVIKYARKDTIEKVRYGFSAQELHAFYPEIGTYDQPWDRYGVCLMGVSAWTVAALQELKDEKDREIEELRKRVTELEKFTGIIMN